MRLVVQRVSRAAVEIEGRVVGSCDEGMLVLVGLTSTDTPATADAAAKKLVALRIFKDEVKPINASLKDISGTILLVSQFTLYGSVKQGNRPSFVEAMAPDQAERLFEYFCQAVKKLYPKVQTGVFGADMQVSLLNDGPVTFILEF